MNFTLGHDGSDGLRASCEIQGLRREIPHEGGQRRWIDGVQSTRPTPRVRDFNPAALGPYATPQLLVRWGAVPNRVWQFSILLPRWLVTGSGQQTVCTARDERLLKALLRRDFGGFTAGPSFVRGVGLRGVQFETNVHREITVLASRSRASKEYFRVLRRELEESSGEEQILVLRQEVIIS